MAGDQAAAAAPQLVDPRPPRQPRGRLVRCKACGHQWESRGRKYPKCPVCNPDAGANLEKARAARAAKRAAGAAVAVVRGDPPPPAKEEPKPAPGPAPAPPAAEDRHDAEPSDLLRRIFGK